MIDEQGYDLNKRWQSKRESIYNLRDNINKLKRAVRADLYSSDEKAKLTAVVIRIMMATSERIGNEESAKNGHFGITQFKPKHISVDGNKIELSYVGKRGVDHEKCFSDERVASILKQLLKRNNEYVFTTEDGFRIRPDKVNRYLKRFAAKSKDIRGFNANRMMVMELSKYGYVKEEKDRKKIFNESLRKVASKIGHGAPTLRKQYLLPEIEEQFYSSGKLRKSIKIN
jgi:DNA topoisomerase-1